MKESFMLQRQRVDIVTTIIIMGFTFAVFFHYCMGQYLHFPYPMDTFLFEPADKFNDLFNVMKMDSDFNPYQKKQGLEPAVYLPFMYVFLYPLLKLLSPWGVFYLLVAVLLITISISSCCLFNELNYNKINTLKATFVLTFMTYPVLFNLDRANLEAFLFAILTMAIIFFYKRYYYVAGCFLAMVVAMKGYPAIFLILFLKEKKIKPLIVCIIFSIMLIIVSLSILGNSFMLNVNELISALNYFHSTYVIGDWGIKYGSGVFGATKLVLNFFSIPFDAVSLDKYFSFFSLFIYILMSALVFLKKMSFWQQLALIVCAYLMLMPASPAYKLLSLYLPLWFFFLDKNITRWKGTLYSILFGLLLIPKQYVPGLFEIMNPILLMLFFILLLMEKSLLTLKKEVRTEI